MQDAMRSMRWMTYALSGFLGFLLLVLVIQLSIGRLDLSVLLLTVLVGFLGVILVDVRRFCEATTDRIRQISALA